MLNQAKQIGDDNAKICVMELAKEALWIDFAAAVHTFHTKENLIFQSKIEKKQ